MQVCFYSLNIITSLIVILIHNIQVVPWGFRKVLNWIKNKYDNPKIFVTENGYVDSGDLEDHKRISYYQVNYCILYLQLSKPLHYLFQNYLTNLLEAMHEDGVQVFGYTAWSLLDNFEWGEGYT